MSNGNESEGEDTVVTRNEISDPLRAGADCGLIVVNSQRQVVGFDPRAGLLLQIPATNKPPYSSEMLGKELHLLVNECLERRVSLSNREIHLSHPSKLSVGIEAVFCGPTESESWIVLRLSDLSARAKLEESVQRLNRLASMGTLAAGLAHEIKNALVSIKTFVDSLQSEDRTRSFYEIVTREVDRINLLVGQMLKLSANSKPSFSTVSLHEVMDQGLRLLQYKLSEHNIQVNRTYKAESHWIKGDVYQLEQAFLNLFLNAVAAMPTGGALNTSLELISGKSHPEGPGWDPSRNWLCATVTDNGCGIAAEAREHLFEAFYTTKPDGTGLGLSITQQIIRDHGGFITLRSQVGQGTSFSIFLPAQEPVN